nr:MAG TPA: hypothetical protein [Caudoviricetes sp.]
MVLLVLILIQKLLKDLPLMNGLNNWQMVIILIMLFLNL